MTSETVSRSVACLVPADSSVDASIVSTLIDLMVPLAAILIFAFSWWAMSIKRRQNGSYLLKKIMLSIIAVLYISYISLTRTIVSTLTCVDVHDALGIGDDASTQYWAVDTLVKCYEGSHALLAAMAGWPCLVFFTLGYPVTVAYLVTRYTKDDYKAGWVYEIAGFLYRAYRKRFIFWDSVIMLRKAVLALVVVFSYPLGANLQSVLAVFVLAVAFYFQTMCRPYRAEFDDLNEIESVTVLVTLLTFVSSLFFNDDMVTDGVAILISIVVIFSNVLLFGFLSIRFARFGATYLRSLLEKEGIPCDADRGTQHVIWIYCFDFLLVSIKDNIAKLCGKADDAIEAPPTRGMT